MKEQVLFTVIIEKEENWYVATEPNSKVASQGKTFEDALANLKEALELFYEDAKYQKGNNCILTTLEVSI